MYYVYHRGTKKRDLQLNAQFCVSSLANTKATQAAMGVTSVHNIDKEGQASIAHTDISPGQFIRIDGIYKLNDFNRARFIRWSPAENKACGYRVARNPGTNRSPEEYESLEQTEKVRFFLDKSVSRKKEAAFYPCAIASQ